MFRRRPWFVFASVEEFDIRARDQVGDGSRDEYLTGTSVGRDALADVNGNSRDVVTAQLDFAGV